MTKHENIFTCVWSLIGVKKANELQICCIGAAKRPQNIGL